MCFIWIGRQHTLLHVWTGRWHRCGSAPGLTSLLYHEDGGVHRAEKRRGRVLNPKKILSDGWRHHERPALSQAQKNGSQKQVESRVSSELRRLCLEDLPVERQERHRSALDSKADNYETVFGIAPCLLALTQGRRKARKLFVKDGETSQRPSLLKVCEEAHRRGVLVQRVSKKDLDRMSSGRVHQGVCLHATPLSYLTEDVASTRMDIDMDTPLWLVLEGVQDPMNLGAILRSAYFLGVDRVASSLHHSCPLSPVVSKASAGIMEVFGVYGYENLDDLLQLKVEQGWQVVGTVGAQAQDSHVPVVQCSDFHITKPTLLLMGGEGHGLSQTLRSLCQILLTIPAGRELLPDIESLNVSVATGILLHSLLSSRRSSRMPAG